MIYTGTSFATSSSYGFATSKTAESKAGKETSEEKSFYANLADYDSSDNAIFQHLLEDESVQDNITLNEDGTYTFHREKGVATSWKEGLAEMLINEQNDTYDLPSSAVLYSDGELAMFRQMTGYNLFQAGGAYTICDDYGNPPAAEDADWVQQAWNMFDSADKGEDSEITVSDLKDVANSYKSFSNTDEETAMIDFLLEMINRNLSGYVDAEMESSSEEALVGQQDAGTASGAAEQLEGLS